MKKIIVLVAIVALGLALAFSAGCTCKRVDPDTKLTTDNFSNCLAAAQELLCTPTTEQKAEAASVLSFITSGVTIASLVTDVPVTVEQVTVIFTMVQAGACVIMTDLALAVQWYNSLTAVIQAQVTSGKLKGITKMPPAIPALQTVTGRYR